MEGSARVGVINEPDVQLLAASEGFFFCVFFLSDETREAGTAQAAAVWVGQGRAGRRRPAETLRDVTLAFFGLINTDSDEMFQTEVALDIVFCWVFFPGLCGRCLCLCSRVAKGNATPPPISPTPRGHKDNIYKGETLQVFLLLFWNNHSSGCAGSGG